MSAREERERKGVVILNTLIRPDQSLDLHKISLLTCRHKTEVVCEALDFYFQHKYGKKVVVHVSGIDVNNLLA